MFLNINDKFIQITKDSGIPRKGIRYFVKKKNDLASYFPIFTYTNVEL